MLLHGTVQSGKLVLTPIVAAARDEYLAKCKDGTGITVEMKRQMPSRTQRQLNAFFGWIMQVATRAMNDLGWDWKGMPLTQDMIKMYLYNVCGHVGDRGEIVTLRNQTTDQTIQFFENIAAHMATDFGVSDTLDFDPMWREHLRENKQP